VSQPNVWVCARQDKGETEKRDQHKTARSEADGDDGGGDGAALGSSFRARTRTGRGDAGVQRLQGGRNSLAR